MALAKASTYTTGPGKHSATNTRSADALDQGRNKDLADWYMRVLTGIYGTAVLNKKWPNTVALKLARRAVIRALRDKTREQLAHGERMLERDPGSWPKTVGEFAALCIRDASHQVHAKQLTHKASPEVARRYIKKMKETLHGTSDS